MAKFRKRPVVIDAEPVIYSLDAAKSNWSALPEWIRSHYEAGDILFLADGLDVRTLEGWVRAEANDILIQGVKGEIYPCKPDIFAATYEPVD